MIDTYIVSHFEEVKIFDQVNNFDQLVSVIVAGVAFVSFLFVREKL